MKIKLIETESRYQAAKIAHWAAKIVKVYGGFMAFESITDWQVWKKQK